MKDLADVKQKIKISDEGQKFTAKLEIRDQGFIYVKLFLDGKLVAVDSTLSCRTKRLTLTNIQFYINKINRIGKTAILQRNELRDELRCLKE